MVKCLCTWIARIRTSKIKQKRITKTRTGKEGEEKSDDVNETLAHTHTRAPLAAWMNRIIKYYILRLTWEALFTHPTVAAHLCHSPQRCCVFRSALCALCAPSAIYYIVNKMPSYISYTRLRMVLALAYGKDSSAVHFRPRQCIASGSNAVQLYTDVDNHLDIAHVRQQQPPKRRDTKNSVFQVLLTVDSRTSARARTPDIHTIEKDKNERNGRRRRRWKVEKEKCVSLLLSTASIHLKEK